MADHSRSSDFHKDGDGPQLNAIGGGVQNNNIGDGNQFPGAVFQGVVNIGRVDCPRSSEPLLRERCLQSLAFPEMESRSKDVDTATPGTCEWLLGHDTYKSWEQSSRGLLWIKGKPGSGKSTLLRHALNRIEADKGRDNAIVLSFFFYGRGVELQRTPLGLFRSLLHQLLSQAPVALRDLVDTFEKNDKERGKLGEKWAWHLGDMQGFFQASIPKVLENRSVWLFVDALDESSNHAEMIKKLQSLLWGLPTSSQFHICFSCRHDLNFDKSGEFKICLEDENEKDISTYVRFQLSTSSTSPELRESEIPKIITEEARGLFMWARLAMEKVLELDREGKGLREIEKEIRSIPPDLHDLYHELVDQMSETEASLKLIRWICFANRSLSPDELRWALVIDATPPPQSLEECRSKDDWISNTDRMKKRVQALSRGLVEVITSSDTQVVQFIHQSVKDYFIDEGISILDQSSKPEAPTADMEGHAHYQLSRACIRYLAMEEIGQSISHERDDMTSKFPFLHYAATSWVAHTKQSETRNVPQDDLLDYFGWPSEELVKRWVRIYQKLDRDSDDCPPEDTSMIHPVSRYQLIGPLRMILKAGTGIDKRDGSGRTPLSWAAANGHEVVVKLLLGTDKADDNDGWTPLWWAARNGHEA
ncbi:putative Pfs NB-ARC and ankyrin-domain-containing protein, partial [Stachybotrys elegans]